MKKNISIGFIILLFTFSFSIRLPDALSKKLEEQYSIPTYIPIQTTDHRESIIDTTHIWEGEEKNISFY